MIHSLVVHAGRGETLSGLRLAHTERGTEMLTPSAIESHVRVRGLLALSMASSSLRSAPTSEI